jgi:hypothetical protein
VEVDVRRGGTRLTLAATLTVLLGLLGNLATGTVNLPAEWTALVWILVAIVGLVTIALEVRYRAERPDGDPGDSTRSVTPASVVTNTRPDPHGDTMRMGQTTGVEVHEPQTHTGTPAAVSRQIVGTIPPRADIFQNRRISAMITEILAAGDPTVFNEPHSPSGLKDQSIVLSGLGGVGKTQLAVHHALALWNSQNVDVLLWLEATSRDQILSGFHRAAVTLFGVQHSTPRQAADQVLAWMAGTDQQWLIVLDDLQDPSDIHGLWPPQTRSGRVIVTTRCRHAALRADGRHFIAIEPFAPDEAIEFLCKRLANRQSQIDGAAALAEEFGFLPLALSPAAAYIADHPALTCTSYRDLLTDRRLTLAQLQPDRPPDGHRASITATWSLSIDRADQLSPRGLAQPTLTVAALLDPNGIPDEVFASDAIIKHLQTFTRQTVDASTVRDALSCLHNLSLITYDPDTPHQAVRVHALIQRAIYENLGRRKLAATARVAARALLQAWPGIERDTAFVAALRANVTRLRSIAGSALWHRKTLAVLLRAGDSLGESGQFPAARDYFRQLAEESHHELFRWHPVTWSARANYAHWLGEAGDPDGAVSELNALLHDTRWLGRKNRFILRIRRNHARWRSDTDDPVGAATAMDELANDFVQVFGPNHPETLYARNIQARCHANAGDPVTAATAMDELANDFARVLGPDHPDTLSARNNLAGFRSRAGDPANAVAAFTELLNDLLRILGPDHPRTLRTRNNLGRSRAEAGDPTGAAIAFNDLINDYLRVLGPNHPDTRNARNNLARARAQAGAEPPRRDT